MCSNYLRFSRVDFHELNVVVDSIRRALRVDRAVEVVCVSHGGRAVRETCQVRVRREYGRSEQERRKTKRDRAWKGETKSLHVTFYEQNPASIEVSLPY